MRTRDWPIVTGLLLLAFVPSLAGAVRVATLAGGAARTPDNARFVDAPVPVVVHVLGAVLFAVLGAFQLAPGVRARHRRWHRLAGRVVFGAGVAVALSGLWMTATYALPDSDNAAFNAQRYVFGTFMLVALVLGLRAALRRDLRAHRAWMLRAYAVGLGAGSQVFTSIPLAIALSSADPRYPAWRAVAMGAAWVINLAVAEWVIRRGRLRPSAAARPRRP
ncbi:DUF2306 domain-containing protein [Dactylosporangium sp. NPDC051485]|uniref:DUF2306 domain-containing protein n=1 Tax=Dactylosporangium sp. NPDC051485 TaxID=3154846 RepID=UPI00343438B2